MKYYLINKNDSKSLDIKNNIEKRLTKQGWTLEEQEPELVITIGGDGTFLRAIHKYLNRLDKTLFTGIHSGTLGFYTDYHSDELETFFTDFANIENSTISNMPLLEVTLNNQEKYYALNEVRIENNIKTLKVEVAVDDVFLEKYRGNGLIVCTPTGSTAYNRSLGGPIIDHRANAFVLTEVAGIHHNAYRSLNASLVLSHKRVLHLKIADSQGNIFGLDHLVISKEVKDMRITLSDKMVQIMRFKKNIYISKIRNTLISD